MPHLTGLRCIQHRGYLAGFDGAVFGRRAKGAARETGLALRVDASAAVELSGTRAASTAIAASLRTASVPASCSAASLSAPGASKRPDGVGCVECGRRSWAQSPPSKSALEAKRGPSGMRLWRHMCSLAEHRGEQTTGADSAAAAHARVIRQRVMHFGISVRRVHAAVAVR